MTSKNLHKGFCILAIAALLPGLALADAVEPLAQTKISGYKVLTAQFSLAAKQSINATKRAVEAQMAAIAFLASSLEQMELFNDFGPTLGQGAQVCDAVNQRADISRIASVRSAYEIGRVANAGRPPLAPTTYTQTRVKQQLDDYCTAEQHNLGICRSKFDGMAGMSTEFSGLDIHDQLTKKQLKAVNDFVTNLVPPPLPHHPGKCGPRCASAAVLGRQLDTFSSMAALGLSSHFSNRIGTKTYAQIKGSQ